MEDALAPYGGDFIGIQLDVLILVVMEDALARVGRCPYVACAFSVLILVVMEDALAQQQQYCCW